MKDALQEFLKKKQVRVGRVFPRERKRAWLNAVERLYSDITNDLLREPLADEVASSSRRKKTLSEPRVGTYTIPELVIRVGDEEVVFSPKGVNVVGAAGRVDLIGERDEVTLVREVGPGKLQDNWSIVEQRIPSPKLVPLTKESLLTALRAVMRP